MGYVGVLYQREAFGEPCGVEEGLVHAHQVHVEQARLRTGGSRSEGVAHVGVEVAHGLPRHAWLPDGMPRDIGVAGVAEYFAIHL